MGDLPWTPDFESYPVEHFLQKAVALGDHVEAIWSDGSTSEYDVFLLRENSPDSVTVHPQSREMLISPLDIPEDLKVVSAWIDESGALAVTWSDKTSSRYHPGWLRAHGWFEDQNMVVTPAPGTVLWNAQSLPDPPTHDGEQALAEDDRLLAWLEDLQTFGIARLRGLPDQDGLLENVVRKIGAPRESNFGPMYVLEIKDEPDSNAFTSRALLQHSDMPTRECPHGLQFLFCRRNTTHGGEGVYVDGFRVAADIQDEEPDVFNSLTQIPWMFNNRSRTSDFRFEAPIIETDTNGAIKEIRLTAWLRAPLKAPLEVQRKAYSSVRTLTRYLQDSKYQLVFAYEPGDLLTFDNRRVLHGRRAYDGSIGERYIEGIYADRDELCSRIRILRRKLNARA